MNYPATPKTVKIALTHDGVIYSEAILITVHHPREFACFQKPLPMSKSRCTKELKHENINGNANL